VIDTSTEVSIIMLSVNLVAYLRVRLSRKLAVVACFAPRSLVIAASIVRLIWLYPITPHSSPEFRLWLPAILMQIHVCLSICTACIPYMVPFFKSLEGSLRRRHMVDSAGYYTNERGERQTSSLWFRRHTKSSKNLDSWDSIVVVAPRYERVSQASPYIHTPPAISPLTPPRWISPPSTADTQAPSGPGLLINIPMGNSPLLRTADVGSPQTASSFALSPSCTSPIPLFPFEYSTPPRKVPTQTRSTWSPNTPTSISSYSSREPSPINAIRPARFSLFPQPRSPESICWPHQRNSGLTPSPIPPIRDLRPQTAGGITRHTTVPRSTNKYQQTTSLSSAAEVPKFSTAPQPRSPPSTITSPTSGRKHVSAQDIPSPMGEAINHYFSSASPLTVPAAAAAAAPFSMQRQRNQGVLSPSNTLRTCVSLPTSPPQVPLPALPAHRPLMITRTVRAQTMPTLRDARSSPRVVVREPS
jgi:hypothetical protein